MNELSLRHIFASIEGKTSGPNCFSGEIGTQLASCHILPVIRFQSLPSRSPLLLLDDSFLVDLSTDQQYLYHIPVAVSSGKVSSALSLRKPGK